MKPKSVGVVGDKPCVPAEGSEPQAAQPALNSIRIVYPPRFLLHIRGARFIIVEHLYKNSQACDLPVNIEFDGVIWFWRGPAPWFFVTIPLEQSRDLKVISNLVTYGWGVLPVQVRIGKTTFKTSLFPKDEYYIVPIKAAVRKAEKLEEGDTVTIHLDVDL
jgi:hypothetical protein